MRWYKKESKFKYKDGDTRIVNRFLLFPKKLYQPSCKLFQTRWLEIAIIKQVYRPVTFEDYLYMMGPWYDNEWVD